MDPYAAAALTRSDVDQAQHLLGLLTRAHLIRPTNPGRYGMHDLLRAYADLADDGDSEQERRAALTRMFDHYLATAAAAMDALHPAEQGRRPRIPLSATHTLLVADPAAARNWLDAERVTLTAVCAHYCHPRLTRAYRQPGRHSVSLPRGRRSLSRRRGHPHPRHAARFIDDPAAEAHALASLGVGVLAVPGQTVPLAVQGGQDLRRGWVQ